MFKNYFKIAWRNLVKRRLYSAINIFGLSLAIACALLLYLFISYHLSFDRYHATAARTYRVVNELYYGKTIHEKGASIAMYRAMATGVAHVSNAAVLLSNYSFTVTVNDSSSSEKRFKEDKNVALVPPGWFTIFDHKWIAGDASALSVPNTAVITQRQSVKYFGNTNPIGKTIVLDNRQPVTIVGMLSDEPFNTDLKYGLYISLSSLQYLQPGISPQFFSDWGWMNSTTSLYLTLNDKRSKTEAESAIAALVKANMGDNAKYYHFWLQPLSDIHFNAEYGGTVQKSLLLTLAIIGALILAIAAFNYINICIAQQSKRMMEIGTRKVLGGTPWQLFQQFIMETFITVSLSVMVGAVIVALLLPAANQFLFLEAPLHLLSYKNLAIFLAVVVITLVLISGFYPAFILSRINVFKAMKAETGTWKAGLLRKTLVVAQNAAACILIICAFMMVLQVHFLKNTDIGFNRDAVIMVPLPVSSPSKKEALKDELRKIPQVVSLTFCDKPPSSENNFGGSVKFDNRPDWEPWPAGSPIGDSSYVRSFGLRIIAGRNIRESKASPEYLINETMVHKLGLKDAAEAVGKSLVVGQFNDQQGTIVGVVRDFNSRSLAAPIEPVVMASVPGRYNTIGVKLNAKNLQAAIQQLRNTWEEAYPEEVFEYNFLDDQIAWLYKQQDLQQKIISLAGFVAIIISCLGLLGLASLITLQRTKEIGIRKVVGASVTNIAFLLSKDFLKLILISITIASPVAWWLISRWLQNFAHHIDIKWWVFAVAGFLSVLIALVTISFQSIKAAIANPVESLRTE